MAPPQIVTSPAPAPSAGYGRSCTNCSRAKCKCILRPDGRICERCHRLRKECQPMVSSRKRTVKKSSSSRTAQLEEKLDDLVSILRASQSQPASQQAKAEDNVTQQLRPDSARAQLPEGSATGYPSRLDSLAQAATSSSTASAVYRLPTPQMPPSVSMTDASSAPEKRHIPFPDISAMEADSRLDKFRSWLRFFGFMHLRPETTAEALRRDRPMLYLALMMITSMSVPEQQIASEVYRKELLQRAYGDSERSLDLLLSLIAFLAWAHFNTGTAYKPFIVPYCQLAITLVYEMGLGKSLKEEQHFAACFKVYGPGKGVPVRPLSRPRTMEERRTILAFWFLSSQLSSFTGKMDTLRWTAYMAECLEMLETEPELPSDETLALLVRLQRINDDAQTLLMQDAMAEEGGTPTFMFRKGLKERLNTIKNTVRPEHTANPHVQAHLYATEMQVESVGLFVQSAMPEHAKVDGLYALVKAVRSWYDLFLNMPPQDVPGMPFSFFVQFTQTHVVLYKLTVSDDPAWDKSYLRSTADPSILFDRSIERFQQIAAVYPMKTNADAPITVFSKGASMINHIKASWEPALAQHLGGLPTPESQVANSAGLGMTPSMAADPNAGLGDPSAWDFSDMGWMTDVFGPWEF